MNQSITVTVIPDAAAMDGAVEAVNAQETAAWRVVSGMRRRGVPNEQRLCAAIKRAEAATAARRMVVGMVTDMRAVVAARKAVAA